MPTAAADWAVDAARGFGWPAAGETEIRTSGPIGVRPIDDMGGWYDFIVSHRLNPAADNESRG